MACLISPNNNDTIFLPIVALSISPFIAEVRISLISMPNSEFVYFFASSIKFDIP